MSQDDQIADILRQVAAGTMAPEVASAKISELRQVKSVATADQPVARVRVTGLVHPTRIVGDSAVKDVLVTGPHQVTREGDVMVVRGLPMGEAHGWFSFRWPERLPFGSNSSESPLRPIVIRMNPELPLEVEMAAGLLTVQGVTAPIRANIQAGSAKLEGVRGPLDLDVTWGTVSVIGQLNSGSSRVRCDAGTVRVTLSRQSSVRVVARSTLGKITLPGDAPGLTEGWTMGGEIRQAAIGDGEAELQVEATTGAVWVELG